MLTKEGKSIVMRAFFHLIYNQKLKPNDGLLLDYSSQHMKDWWNHVDLEWYIRQVQGITGYPSYEVRYLIETEVGKKKVQELLGL